MAWYTISINLGKGNGDYGTEWKAAKDGNMSKQAAEGLLNQFGMQYESRLFRGKEVGRLVGQKSPVKLADLSPERRRRVIAEMYTAADCTLDGQSARIVGRLNPFATVATFDNPNLPQNDIRAASRTVEFSWEAVERVMKSTKEFKS